ncbi:MAG: class I SAM-dependent methyltransferase [Ignavibacteriae bacterium]|nr:class I SAM-dependent methyltransferase [Ignavibacteriota bacterium]
MHLIHRKSCRVCGSTALTKVIDLGEQYLQGSFMKPGDVQPPTRRISTVLVRCNPMLDENACGLLQMENTVPPEVLYSTYWYRSGTNNTMRTHLKGIVDATLSMIPKPDATVLDIGCNDGTMLKYYPASFTKFGVDPSNIAQEISRDITVVQDIFPSEELVKRLNGRKVDILTSIAMFYDLENPALFTESIKKILAPGGLWVFEMSYMPLMLKMNSYDTICHEHLEYYSLAVLENICRRTGLKIIKAELNNINGGSIRCFATHMDNFSFKKESYLQALNDLRQQEFDMELDTDKPYKNFQDHINIHREELTSLLRQLKKEGRHIHAYGASTKGNTILQWCGLDSRIIDAAADRNPEKDGAYTLGTEIPIVSEEKSRAMRPDYYLVLPWHFKDEFIARERETIAQGTKFIFPLPAIEIVG